MCQQSTSEVGIAQQDQNKQVCHWTSLLFSPTFIFPARVSVCSQRLMELADIMAGFGDLDQLFNDIGWDFPGTVGSATYSLQASEGLGILYASPSSNMLTPGIKSEPMTSSECPFQTSVGHFQHSSDMSEAASVAKPESNIACQIWQPQQQHHQQAQQHPPFSMDPSESNTSSGQKPVFYGNTPNFQSPALTTSTSTPVSSVLGLDDPSQPAPDAQPLGMKAAKPKRIRNNVGPKHQLDELQQVVAQKNQQIAQLLQENVRLKDTTG